MTFDLPSAIYELGEPLDRKTYTTAGLGEFQVELLNFFPPSENIQIEELTWDISSEVGISDSGIERLTIWYAHAKDKVHARKNPYIQLSDIWEISLRDSTLQLPVTFAKWNINTQY